MADDGGLDRLKRALAPRYQVVREVGRGGSARVYLAREPKLDRDVAIKVLDPGVAHATGTERFLREIRVTASLRHPHILPVLDSGDIDGIPFYVTPYVAGRSLRERLARERQLPLDEVVRLAREIASALETAHRHGIVHRDVKPANVLLEADQAVVADFGVLRALEGGPAGKETTSGVALGSPLYMSPEQSTGTDPIDGRADVYGLACLVYEAIVGEPPFTGPTPQAIFAKKVSIPPAPPSRLRSAIPRAVDRVVLRGLSPSPADRQSTPLAFAEALSRAAVSPGEQQKGRAVVAAAIATVLVLGGWWAYQDRGPPLAADPDLWVLFPFEYGSVEVELAEVEQLTDAITRWSGVRVVDPLLVRDRLPADPEVSAARAAELARDLGAGRFVRGLVSRVGDSLRVQAVLYESVGDGSVLYDVAVRLPSDATTLGPVADSVADELLFRGRLPHPGDVPSETHVLAARTAFMDGNDALRSWDLAKADSDFTSAASADPNFGEAHLWTALTRFWRNRPRSQWSVPVGQASVRADYLTPREQLVLEALRAHESGDLGAACPLWSRLASRDPFDYSGWFSLAQCLSTDNAVVPDAGSPSGWSFRTSHHAAVDAYKAAFRLHPAILSSFEGDAFEPLIAILKASGNQRRRGRTPTGDARVFVSDPGWRGDSLSFVPWPAAALRSQLTVDAREFQLALLRMRETFRDIAASWVAQEPGSGQARAALAIALTMLGEPSGLDTLQAARRLAHGPSQRLSIMSLEVWLRVALSTPSDEGGLRRARALADTLLADDGRSPDDRKRLSGLAALTGRAHRAAQMMAEPGVGAEPFAPPIRRWGPPLMVYAAFGGPIDSIRALERRGWSSVREELEPDTRDRAIAEWLARPATLAFPTYSFVTLDSLTGRGDWLLDAEVDFANGDRTSPLERLRQIALERRAVPPANLTWDSLLPEAWLWFELGDYSAAAAWLDPSFAALPQASPHVLSTPERAAALVRAMALRSRLALVSGDTAAAGLWARATSVLWGDADPFLQVVLAGLPSVPESRP